MISTSVVANDTVSLLTCVTNSFAACSDACAMFAGNSIGIVSPAGNCKFGTRSPICAVASSKLSQFICDATESKSIPFSLSASPN